MKICVVTSMAATIEPRAPRHAVAAKAEFPHAEVVFVDHQPRNNFAQDPPILLGSGVERLTLGFPWRGGGRVELGTRKASVSAARWLARTTGLTSQPLFGAPTIGLDGALDGVRADAYWAHNIESLLPAARAARRHGAKLLFDCMEYYSDMGDAQRPEVARAARRLEAEWLPRCTLVTASSDVLADVLEREYGIPRPLPLYNTPPIEAVAGRDPADGLALYWRNSVVDLSQRGLDDALVALTQCPHDVTLTVQGRPPMDGGSRVRRRIDELGLAGRVTILPAFAPGDAVRQASRYHVGLCLERPGPKNHEYTVSNKLFDYMMAGLAIISSDMPSLQAVVDRSSGGLLYEAGSPQSLAARINELRASPHLREDLASKARAFALSEGNMEADMARLRTALRTALGAV